MSAADPVLVGVDVGGTFTDAAIVVGERRFSAKVATTPADQSEGVLNAIATALGRAGSGVGAVRRFAHGTTVGTNALLEGRGCRVVLCATAGFGDVLALRRQDRADLYRLEAAHPTPVVVAHDVVEVAERCTPDGVLLELTDDEVGRVVARVRALAPDAVAIGLLFSYAHPAHELRLARALRAALPALHVTASVEVLPEIREYERISTAAIDAYLGPAFRVYLGALERRAAGAGLPAPAIMQSNGGLIDAAVAAEHPAWTVLSGPAGGVMGAVAIATASGHDDILTLDMGGTSCDVAVVLGGTPTQASGVTIGGHRISLPVVDIETVSAGGGSIAWVDAGGALRVGPQSAGARPGPAAYGLGGTLPTVTDANVVLGRLAGVRLGEGVDLDAERARAAVARPAEALALTVEDCAAAILAVAVEEMVRALRLVSIARGIDPRSLTLVAFGGAGPLHACAVAEELAIPRVLVPEDAGVLAALGLLAAPERRDHVQSVLLPLHDGPSLDRAVRDIRDRAAASMSGASIAVAADCRYQGQRHHLTLPWPDPQSTGRLRSSFDAAHRRRYGDDDPERAVEVVSLRASAIRPAGGLRMTGRLPGPPSVGPEVLRLPGSTCWLAPGWSARWDTAGSLLLERDR